MKTITDKEARQTLLHELRRATCLQVGVWDYCSDVINEALSLDSDSALCQVVRMTLEYAGKELQQSDLDELLSTMAEPICIERIAPNTRLTLLKAFQNAINMQAELWIVASNLTEILGRPLEDTEQAIRDIASMTDTGMEVDEMDLRCFLGEPLPQGYTRIAGPIVGSIRPLN